MNFGHGNKGNKETNKNPNTEGTRKVLTIDLLC